MEIAKRSVPKMLFKLKMIGRRLTIQNASDASAVTKSVQRKQSIWSQQRKGSKGRPLEARVDLVDDEHVRKENPH